MPRPTRKKGKIRAVSTTQSRSRLLTFARILHAWHPCHRSLGRRAKPPDPQMLFEKKPRSTAHFFKKGQKPATKEL